MNITKKDSVLLILGCLGLSIFLWTGTTKWDHTPIKKTYDYNIDILNDTIWLYNGEGVLLLKGRYDSLPELISSDNL